MVFEAGALWVAFKEFNLSRGKQSIIKAIRRGKDPTLFVVVFEDTAAMLGLLIAFVGLLLYQLTGNPVWDALASISIGVVLIVTAWCLAIESKGLLIGESAEPEVEAGIRAIFQADQRILQVNEVATLHMGPDFIVVTLSVDFAPGIDSDRLESSVTELTQRVRAIDARIQRVFIEAEGGADHRRETVGQE